MTRNQRRLFLLLALATLNCRAEAPPDADAGVLGRSDAGIDAGVDGGIAPLDAATPSCFSPKQNAALAYDQGAFGCPCRRGVDRDVCVLIDHPLPGHSSNAALVCQSDHWEAVLDGPCGIDAGTSSPPDAGPDAACPGPDAGCFSLPGFDDCSCRCSESGVGAIGQHLGPGRQCGLACSCGFINVDFTRGCTADQDCQLVRTECCPCNSGGPETAVLASRAAAWEADMTRYCQTTDAGAGGCATVYLCGNGRKAICAGASGGFGRCAASLDVDAGQ